MLGGFHGTGGAPPIGTIVRIGEPPWRPATPAHHIEGGRQSITFKRKERTMPILLWILGIPIPLIILFLLLH
jgi:hypothetical protein